MSREVKSKEEYNKRLLKTIPSEIVGLYMAVNPMIVSEGNPAWLAWGTFVLCLIATPLWLYFGQGVKGKLQLTLSTLAFPIWVASIGGAFLTFQGFSTVIGGILVALYSGLIVPLCYKIRDSFS